MNNKLSDMEGRVKLYWSSDGIVELLTGGMFILLGVYFWVQGSLDVGPAMNVFLQVGLVLLMVAGAISVSWLVNILKTRLTYPRTGFVEYHLDEPDARQRRYVVVTVAMIMLIASEILFKYIPGFDSMVLVIGILAGVVFLMLRGKSSGGKRFPVLGLFSILLGIGLSLSGLSEIYRLASFFGLFGMASLISGGLVLRRYLNQNPMRVEQQHG